MPKARKIQNKQECVPDVALDEGTTNGPREKRRRVNKGFYFNLLNRKSTKLRLDDQKAASYSEQGKKLDVKNKKGCIHNCCQSTTDSKSLSMTQQKTVKEKQAFSPGAESLAVKHFPSDQPDICHFSSDQNEHNVSKKISSSTSSLIKKCKSNRVQPESEYKQQKYLLQTLSNSQQTPDVHIRRHGSKKVEQTVQVSAGLVLGNTRRSHLKKNPSRETVSELVNTKQTVLKSRDTERVNVESKSTLVLSFHSSAAREDICTHLPEPRDNEKDNMAGIKDRVLSKSKCTQVSASMTKCSSVSAGVQSEIITGDKKIGISLNVDNDKLSVVNDRRVISEIPGNVPLQQTAPGDGQGKSSDIDRTEESNDLDEIFQSVTATVHKEVLLQLQPGLQDFLQNSLPLHLPVCIEWNGEQMVVKGSFRQMRKMAEILSKMKREQCVEVHKINPTYEGEAKANDNVDCLPCLSLPESLPAACGEANLSSTLLGKKVVYVQGDNGIDLQVNVDLPLPLPHTTSQTLATKNVMKTTVRSPYVVTGFKDKNPDGDFCSSANNESSVTHQVTENGNINETESLVQRGSGSESQEILLAKSLALDQDEEDILSVESQIHSNQNSSPIETRKGLHNLEQGNTVVETGTCSSSSTPQPPSLKMKCGICEKVCLNEADFIQHMEVQHELKGEIFWCEVCSLAYPDRRSLLAHLKSKHVASSCTCQICGKKFQFQRYLRTHLQRHAGVKRFECSICGWRFFERHKLKWHLETHKAAGQRNLPYKCCLCHKQFFNKASWSDHCNTHSGQRPFACDLCNARFSHRVGLRTHQVTHERVKPFACTQCPKMFGQKTKLDAHMTLHTGVSKYTCQHCAKVFTAGSSLKRHVSKCMPSITHDTSSSSLYESPLTASQSSDPSITSLSPDGGTFIYVCGICGQSFPVLSTAEQHAFMHQDTNPVDLLQLKNADTPIFNDTSITENQSLTVDSIGLKVEGEQDVGGAACIEYIIDSVPERSTENSPDQFLILSRVERNSHMNIADAGVISVSGENVAGIGCKGEDAGILKTLSEQDEIQLAANTLADLSSWESGRMKVKSL